MRHLIYYPENAEMPPNADQGATSFLEYCRGVKAPGAYAPREQFERLGLERYLGAP